MFHLHACRKDICTNMHAREHKIQGGIILLYFFHSSLRATIESWMGGKKWEVVWEMTTTYSQKIPFLENPFYLVSKLKNFGSTSRHPSYTLSLASMCTNIIITEHTILVHNSSYPSENMVSTEKLLLSEMCRDNGRLMLVHYLHDEVYKFLYVKNTTMKK